MAMFPYVDPHHHNTMWPSHYHGHRHHGGWLTPMLSTPEMTDPMLDRSMHTLAGLPRGLGEMNLTHEGDFEWKCSVAGFRYVTSLLNTVCINLIAYFAIENCINVVNISSVRA